MVALVDFNNIMFSFEAVRRINRSVSNDADRHRLIGFGVQRGSYTARSEESDYFDGRRSITSKIMEGYYIAKQMTAIAGSLEGNGNESVIQIIEQKAKAIREDIPESELSRILDFLLETEGCALIGSRTEKKFWGLDRGVYSSYRRNPDERRLNELLLKEEEAIRHGLAYELKRQ